MINLILDTNIYRKDIKRNSAAFQTLESLIQQNFIKLHIPNFVEREFVSQLSLYYVKCYEDIMQNMYKLSEIEFLDVKKIKILETDHFDKNKILEQANVHFLNWLTLVNAERYSLDLENYQSTFDDYFEGKPPFKGIKIRKDIPDSLVFQNIKQICQKESNIHFISDDKEFLKACGESFSNLNTHSSLDEFIRSDTCKPLLSKSDESILLEYCRHNIPELTSMVAQIVPSALSGKNIVSPKIPDDNNEGSIVAASEPESIKYQLDRAVYYGKGILVIPCTFNTEVEVYYYLYKPDYYAMEQVLSVSDHSEHYYQVSQNFEIFVEAAVRLEFEITKDDDTNEVELNNCGIDSLVFPQ